MRRVYKVAVIASVLTTGVRIPQIRNSASIMQGRAALNVMPLRWEKQSRHRPMRPASSL
jgi:hypothetical protein